MSKYSIYRIDHYDPVLVGKRRRRLSIRFFILVILAAPLMIFLHDLLKIEVDEANLILMVALWGIYILLYRKLKSENKSFKIIGDIEFTKTCIVKQIGDSHTEINYDSINSVNLHNHIPALNITESKSGFFTHILSIDFKDSHKETFIVSDRPAGKLRDISIVETIKTLKRLHSALN